MLNVKAYHQHTRETTLQFLLQTLIVIWIVSVAKHTGCFQLLLLTLNDMDSAKGYHAAEEGCTQKEALSHLRIASTL